MVDEIDIVSENIEREHDAAVSAIRAKADIPKGIAGECEYCYEISTRLVNNACARCRDKYKLG